MDLQILPLSDADLEPVVAIAGEIWRDCYSSIITTEQLEYMLAGQYTPENIRREMNEKGITWRKIIVDDALAGFLAYGPYEPGVIKLHKLYLSEKLHGRGIGAQALTYVIEAARASGAKKLTLNVNKKNTRAARAYERQGFYIEKEGVFDIGRGFVMDDFIMSKDLV